MKSKLKNFFSKLGPGFITGASDDDPSGIAAYSQTGALFGLQQLWTSLFSFPFMVAIQEMCGRIGIVTGKGLAGVIRKHYSRTVLFFTVFILLIANIINIGADLGAMASSLKLILPLPFSVLLIIITGVSISLQILVPYKKYAGILKYFAFSLFAYVIVAFLIHADWGKALYSTFVPQIIFSERYLINIVAILGTTISPYLFFWQTSEEVEEEVSKGMLRSMGAGIPKFVKSDINDLRKDTIFGMFFSNLVMFFIMLSTASTLGKFGITDIETADQAAQALKPLAGEFTYLLFTLGIIGTGLLAIPVLAGSASYALSEALGWKEGLYLEYSKAHKFYGVIILATVVGVFVNFAPVSSFKLLYYSAVLNGLCAPPLIYLIMKISNNRKIMGDNVNGGLSNILGWIIFAVMFICAIVLVLSLL